MRKRENVREHVDEEGEKKSGESERDNIVQAGC